MSFLSARMQADPRRHPRHYVNRPGVLRGPEEECDVWVVDVSAGGARVSAGSMRVPFFDGPGWRLELPDLGGFDVQRLWSRGTLLGLGFDLPEDEAAALDLMLVRLFPREV